MLYFYVKGRVINSNVSILRKAIVHLNKLLIVLTTQVFCRITTLYETEHALDLTRWQEY